MKIYKKELERNSIYTKDDLLELIGYIRKSNERSGYSKGKLRSLMGCKNEDDLEVVWNAMKQISS